MSRIGKQPIEVPSDVQIEVGSDFIFVKGPKGEIKRQLHGKISVSREGNLISVSPKDGSKETRALWGTFRSLIGSMVKGAREGFEKTLVYEGIGFKSEVKSDSSAEGGKVLEMSVGFTNPVRVPAPRGIDFKVEKNQIVVAGADKELVGQVAANIRKVKPPEPYKGKGIRYKDEVILRKAGKKAVAAG